MTDLPNWFVVVMGIGTVFISLVLLVVICVIMGAVCKRLVKTSDDSKTTATPQTAVQPVSTSTEIPNREEFVAAVSAALAEELGTDVTGIRIMKIKKL